MRLVPSTHGDLLSCLLVPNTDHLHDGNSVCRTRTPIDHAPTLRPTRRAPARQGSSREPPQKSEILVVAQELVLILIVDRLEVREVDLVPEEPADPAEALDELRALLRAVRDELEVRAEFAVLLREPLEQRLRLADLLHLEARRLVDELFAVLLLLLIRVDDDLLCGSCKHTSHERMRATTYLRQRCAGRSG